jgi:hypothetical protein
MALLDEAGAAISAGELSALEWVGVTYCCFIYAFEDVRDFERAVQWCERLLEFCDRSGVRSGSALCRAHDAGVLVSRGSWAAAEAQLEAAAGEQYAARRGAHVVAVSGRIAASALMTSASCCCSSRRSTRGAIRDRIREAPWTAARLTRGRGVVRGRWSGAAPSAFPPRAS